MAASRIIFTAAYRRRSRSPKARESGAVPENSLAEVCPAFSPDGWCLAYVSNESGTIEVYVRPVPGPDGRWQISTGGGSLPLWSRDGRGLLFQTQDQRVMAVSYTARGDSFAAEEASDVDGGSPTEYWRFFQLRPSAGREAPRGDSRARC